MQKTEQSFKLEIEVCEQDLVHPYNHVHHANILKLLESGRAAFLDQVGFPIEGLLAQGLFLVISQIQASYKREVKAGQIIVSSDSVAFDGKKILIKQSLINEKGKLAVEAQVESQFLSAEVGRAIFPPPDFMQAVQGYFEATG